MEISCSPFFYCLYIIHSVLLLFTSLFLFILLPSFRSFFQSLHIRFLHLPLFFVLFLFTFNLSFFPLSVVTFLFSICDFLFCYLQCFHYLCSFINFNSTLLSFPVFSLSASIIFFISLTFYTLLYCNFVSFPSFIYILQNLKFIGLFFSYLFLLYGFNLFYFIYFIFVFLLCFSFFFTSLISTVFFFFVFFS